MFEVMEIFSLRSHISVDKDPWLLKFHFKTDTFV